MGKSLLSPKGSDQDGLVREFAEARLEVRATQGMKMPVLHGYIIRFNEATVIDSWEGRFIERIAPGAAKKTLKDNGDSIKILFDHGHDPNIGSKPLAKPMWEGDGEGVRYEGELFDCDYCRELVPGLEAGQYGASFKFRVIKESFDEEPEPSDDNPEGLPKRTIEELKLYEGGPVVFPQYEGASAGVRSRSGTARIFMERAKRDPAKVPELVELFTEWVRMDPDRVRGLLEDQSGDEPQPETKTSADEVTETKSEEGDAEQHPDESNDGAEPAHFDEGRQATTPMSIDSEDRDGRWFEDESEKEWQLP